MSGRVKKWECPECGSVEDSDRMGVPEMPAVFFCRDCTLDRSKHVEMRIKEDTFTYKSRDCPWCGAGLVMPEFAIERGLEDKDTIPCPDCGEVMAFTGNWEETEMNHDNWEEEGEMKV